MWGTQADFKIAKIAELKRMSANKKKIAVIPGDGIGKEVIAGAVAVVEASGAPVEFTQFDWSADRYLKDGTTVPAGGFEMLAREFDAVFVGALGDPRVPSNIHAKEILLNMRFRMDLYANVRPVKVLDESLCPLKGIGPGDVDMVIVRENTEGMYMDIGGVFKAGTPDEVAVNEEINTRKGVERIIRAAFEWAKKNGKKRVAMADKSNAIAAHELWLRTFREVAAQHPDIEAKHFYVDAIAMQMVLKPEMFDVIVTTNLFGDILTDLAAALNGGMGMAPSASLNPDSTPLFEPVHGSAPDIAGKNLVNPVAMLLTSALMLRELGRGDEAVLLERAIEKAVADGQCTRDVGGTLGTKEATDAVLRNLDAAL